MRQLTLLLALAGICTLSAQVDTRAFTRRTLGPERPTVHAGGESTTQAKVTEHDVIPTDATATKAAPAPEMLILRPTVHQPVTIGTRTQGTPSAGRAEVEVLPAVRGPAVLSAASTIGPVENVQQEKKPRPSVSVAEEPGTGSEPIAAIMNPTGGGGMPAYPLRTNPIEPTAEYAAEIERLLAYPRLTIPMRNLPLHIALRTIATTTNMSYIAPDESDFAETVTLRFVGSPWTLLSILKNRHNFELDFENGVWTFFRPNSGELIARTYQLRFGNFTTVTSTARSSASGTGGSSPATGQAGASSGGAPRGGNGNIFSQDSKEIIENLKSLLGIPVTGTEAQIATSGSPGAMAPLQKGRTSGGSPVDAPRADVIFLPDNNQIFVVATRQQHQYVEAFLTVADTRQPLVRIDTILVETARDPRSFLGIDPSNLAGPSLTLGSAAQSAGTDAGGSEGGGKLSTKAFDLGNLKSLAWPDRAVLSTSNLNFQLNLLQQDSTSIVKNRPRLVTVSNREVSIESVIEEPFASSTTNNAFQGSAGGTGQTTTSLERIKNGTSINVLPQVMRGTNGQRYVTLHVSITVSGKVGDKSIFGQSVPITSSTTQTFTVDVPDGFTLALGGLDETRESDAVNKIPIAGDIPLVGYLFKSKTVQNTKRNLIAYITPKIIDIGDADLVHGAYEAMPSTEQFIEQGGFAPESNKKRGPFKGRR